MQVIMYNRFFFVILKEEYQAASVCAGGWQNGTGNTEKKEEGQ